jgi:hypothetical protein
MVAIALPAGWRFIAPVGAEGWANTKEPHPEVAARRRRGFEGEINLRRVGIALGAV